MIWSSVNIAMGLNVCFVIRLVYIKCRGIDVKRVTVMAKSMFQYKNRFLNRVSDLHTFAPTKSELHTFAPTKSELHTFAPTKSELHTFAPIRLKTHLSFLHSWL
jgi:hypothetical protein